MKISFSDRISQDQKDNKKNSTFCYKPRDKRLKQISSISNLINPSKCDYISRLVNTQNGFGKVEKEKIKNFREKMLKGSSKQKQNNKDLTINLSKKSCSRQLIRQNGNFTLNKQKIKLKVNNENLYDFNDNNLVNSQRKQKQQFKFIGNYLLNNEIKSKKSQCSKKQAYRRFDISKLDFSFDIKKNQLSSTCSQMKPQYTSIVSKSRLNIKKILELNKLSKQAKPNVNQQCHQNEKVDSNIQILYKIKSGCFGTIYKARLISTGKLVAIKCIPYDKKYQQRQQQICKIINNPFIVKIHKIYYSNAVETQSEKQIVEKTSKNLKTMIKINCSLDKTDQKNDSNNRFYNLNKNLKATIKEQAIHKIDEQELTENKINLNQQLKKASLNRKQTIEKKKHPNQFHRLTNIMMDLYDCDLNDYIQMKDTVDNLTLKLFCYQMLRSVLYLHSNQICHRDIKPHNFLVKKHVVVLSDFGSAKILKNHKNSNVSYICSRYYRAPQLIFGYKYYDKSIDIWALGCVMAELAVGKPIFPGVSSIDQLIKIIRILGQPNWRKISFMIDNIPKLPQIEPKGLKNIFSPQISPLFIDLMQNMLVFNPLHRITAGQALCHSYFDQIRDQMNFSQICKQMDISYFLTFNRDQLKQSEHLKNKLTPLWVGHSQKLSTTKSNNFFNS